MSKYVKCPNCGHRMRRVGDEYGNWDGESYFCEYCTPVSHDYDEEESLSLYDAAQIWASNGMDEDYTFGYDEDELRKVLGV